MAYLTPTEFVTKMVDAGESKIFMSTRDTLIRAYMAGAILALAAAFAVTVSVQTGQPLLGAVLFPVGFCLLYLLGFDLLTGVFTLCPLAWLDKRPGVTINRKQLVNWLVEAHDEGLSSSEEETLSALFYDEVKFLAHALSRMKEARARGEELSLESVMGAQLSPKSGKKPRALKKNSDPEAAGETSNQGSRRDA